MRALWVQAGHAQADGPAAILAVASEARLTDLLVDHSASNFGEFVTAAQSVGVQVHAWTYQHRVYWHNPAWNIRNSRGESIDWLDFTIAEARTWWADYCAGLEAQYGVPVHLDYVRWPSLYWDRGYMTAQAVQDAVAEIKSATTLPLTAAVFATDDQHTPGQNWRAWLAAGLLDRAMPMCYGDLARVQKYAPSWTVGTVPGLSWRNRFYPEGIWGEYHTPHEIVAIIRECRSQGFWSFSFFDYDHAENAPPAVRQAVGDTDVTEILTKRTYTSKTHNNGDGTFTLEAHAGHIHYKDAAGDLQDVDLQFEDMGTYWRVSKASYRLFVNKDFDSGDLILFRNRYESANHDIYYRPHSIWWVNTDDKSERTKWKDRQAVTGVLDPAGNKITFSNCFGPGVHMEITLRRSGFTKELVIDAKPPTGGTPYTNWALGLVSGWSADNLTLRGSGGDWDELTYYERSERLEVVEAGGAKSYILKAWGVDSDERRRELPVFFEKQGGTLWQGKLIPSEWVENATYPIRMDTTTSYYAGAGDGECTDTGTQTWDTFHDATASDLVDYASTEVQILVYSSGGYVEIIRTFFPIDTSALPDAASVSAATFYIYAYGMTNNDSDGDDWISVIQTDQPDPTQLTTHDYNNCGTVDDPTEGIDAGDRYDISSYSTPAYVSFPLNATGLGWISKTGYTMLGCREGHDCIDSEVAGHNRLRVYTSENSGTSEDPYLSVTYAVPRRVFVTHW